LPLRAKGASSLLSGKFERTQEKGRRRRSLEGLSATAAKFTVRKRPCCTETKEEEAPHQREKRGHLVRRKRTIACVADSPCKRAFESDKKKPGEAAAQDLPRRGKKGCDSRGKNPGKTSMRDLPQRARAKGLFYERRENPKKRVFREQGERNRLRGEKRGPADRERGPLFARDCHLLPRKEGGEPSTLEKEKSAYFKRESALPGVLNYPHHKRRESSPPAKKRRPDRYSREKEKACWFKEGGGSWPRGRSSQKVGLDALEESRNTYQRGSTKGLPRKKTFLDLAYSVCTIKGVKV